MNLTPGMIKFCTTPEKVNEMRKVLELPIVREVRAILLEDAPVTLNPIPPDITDVYANILLGICRGYQRYHNLLDYFGQHFVLEKPVDAATKLEEESE